MSSVLIPSCIFYLFIYKKVIIYEFYKSIMYHLSITPPETSEGIQEEAPSRRTTGGIPMQLRTDMSEAIILRTTELPWLPSPTPGVERRMLSRDDATGVVTSIVRYAPGASYPIHSHPGGEEILVLEGTFADE